MGTVWFSTSVSLVNIPRKVGPAGWLDCIKKAFDHGDLTVVNESKPGSPRAKLYERVADDRNRSVCGLFGSPNPLFADREKWQRVSGQVKRLHGRGPYFPRWPGFNEARYVTAAAYRARGMGSVPMLVLLGTHLVPRQKVPKWWRKRARRKSDALLSHLVDVHTTAGRIVVVAGDMNDDEPPAIPGVTWFRAGVDWIGVAVPRGVTLVGHDRVAFEARTDHQHGLSVDLTFAYNPARQLVRA